MSADSCARRSPIRSDASAKVSQRPVRTSTSLAISSPTRCSSTGDPGRGRLDLLEAVDERERLGIEQGELLLDRDGEVRAGLEVVARPADQLVVGQLLRFTH